MDNSNCLDFSNLTVENQPFPHFSSASTLLNGIVSDLFQWFEQTEEWSLTQTDFYEQYEFSFLNVELPENLQCLISKKSIAKIEEKFKEVFNINSFELVGVTAHKLVHGQRIGIHNDFINEEETHRLVIHINPNWKEENGGFLILFSTSKAEDISKVVHPINNLAFGFEISNHSHHAVSKIYEYSRYTIVYTFKKKVENGFN